jgi:hypothetical protein
LYAQYPLEFFDSNHYGPFFSIIIASFYCIEKDITAACFIMIGTFVKLYGIVGLAFFFFSKHKVKFVAALIIIGALLFIISTPTLISSLLGQQSGMMSAFGDIQSLMAVGTGINAGLGIAKAGTMSALGMGANVISDGLTVIIHPQATPLKPLHMRVPNDPSSGFFFAVAAAINEGSSVTLRNQRDQLQLRLHHMFR